MRAFAALMVLLPAAVFAAAPLETTLRYGRAASPALTADLKTDVRLPAREFASPRTSPDLAAFTEVWNLPIAGFAQAPYTVGVCAVANELWVTSGGTGTGGELAVISIYDLNNSPPTLIERVEQPVATYGWGMRDMAHSPARGEVYAAGPQERELLVIDAATRTLKWRRTLAEPAPALLRTMARDGLDSLYTMDGEDPMTKFSPDPPHGARRWIDVLPTDHTGFGAAINPADRHIWFYNETDGDPNKLVRYDWPEMTGRRTFAVAGASSAGGGCDIWGSDYLIVLDQNEPDDVVRCLLIKPFDHDLAVTAIERPTFFGEFPLPFAPRATVRNRGSETQDDFVVRCLILDEDLVPVYDETLFVSDPLARGESRAFDFPAWPSPEIGTGCRAVVTVLLDGDEDPANNDMFRTFDVGITLEARWDDMRQMPNPAAGWAWYSEGNSWLHRFPNYWGDVYLTGTKMALFPSYWPSPGGARFRAVLRDNTGPAGAPGAELHNSGTLTGTRGAWNTHMFPVSVPYSQDFWYVEYNQVGDYPNCPGLAIDGIRNSPVTGTQWQKVSGAFSTDNQKWGDWGIRGFIVKPPVKDVGVTAILRPSSVVVEGAQMYPRVRVQNFGNIAVGPFAVRVVVREEGNQQVVFDKREYVSSLSPGANVLFDFTSEHWTASPVGNFTVRCSTELAGDDDTSNDHKDAAFTVVPGLLDVGVARVYLPTGTIAEKTRIFPKMLIQNYGNVDAGPFYVRCIVTKQGGSTPVFDKREEITGLASGVTLEFEFKDSVWVAGPVARFTVRCTTELPGDEENLNDWCDELFKVAPSWPLRWREAAPMPAVPNAVQANAGAWLAVGPDRETELGVRESGSGPLNPETMEPLNPVLYAGKGYKTTDFYKYRPYEGVNGTWSTLAPIPDTIEGKLKPPSKGTRGICATEDRFLYLTRGNNTLGFCRYDIENNAWEKRKDVPLGSYKKKVKGGEDMVVVSEGGVEWVYLLKGGNTEFYRYNTATDEWDEGLPEVPYGGGKQKYNRGSFLVYDGENYIYAHQAKLHDGTHHYMYRYDIAAGAWSQTPLKGMPVLDLEGSKLKKKKSADGGSGAWYAGKLYALKGGNTPAFYHCDPAEQEWTALDVLPIIGSTQKKKRVKAGGDLVYFAERGFFALKGNKTYEFWRYVEQAAAQAQAQTRDRDGVAGDSRMRITDSRLQVTPNPLTGGFATLRFGARKGMEGQRDRVASLRLFDAVGRCVLSRSLVIGDWSLGIPLDLRGLSGGVYLVRLDADDFTQTQKLVVQK